MAKSSAHSEPPSAANAEVAPSVDWPELMRLLELTHAEEQYYLEAQQKRVAFYSSLVSAVLAATIGGAMNASEPLHFFLLTIGPLLVFTLSEIALDGTFRLYQRFLEAITIRAKLEQALNLTLPQHAPKREHCYWTGESLIPDRHRESRLEMGSSNEFIDRMKHKGYQQITRLLLRSFQGAAIILLLLLSLAGAMAL